jgi:transcriptional regulator with XRE-family HTH domain
MEQHQLTLQAMAERTGLSVASIAALRTGTRGKRPQPHTLAKLAAVLDCEPEELDLAVDASVDERRREQMLLRRFRELDADAKTEVERLLARLRTAR